MEPVVPMGLESEEAERALALALLVIRAGARDSLGWWDDEALTAAGRFVLARLFPRNPARAAIRLAFRAARERHVGVLTAAGVNSAMTLLDITESLFEGRHLTNQVPQGPIASSDEFRRQLILLAPDIERLTVPPAAASGILDLTTLAAGSDQSLGRQATVLAAGYLGAEKGQPVFPFIRLAGEDRP